MFEVGFIWSLYIVLVLVVFVFLTSPKLGCLQLSASAGFFWAFIIGLIFVLIWYFYINRNTLTTTSKNWLNALLVVAIVLPVLALLWWLISWIWRGGCGKKEECPPKPCEEKPVCEVEKPNCAPKSKITQIGEEDVPVTFMKKKKVYSVEEDCECPGATKIGEGAASGVVLEKKIQ